MTPEQYKVAQAEVDAQRSARETARTMRILGWCVGIAFAIAGSVKVLTMFGV